MNKRCILSLLTLCTLTAWAGDESNLVATLQSAAPLKEKADACRALIQQGTSAAVPALAALLGDPELGHRARLALDAIPDPAAGRALRDALGTLSGRALAGVVESAGARRDEAAVPTLVRLLAHTDGEVAEAAARALGQIGGGDAADALRDALVRGPAPRRPLLAEACLACAERQAGWRATQRARGLRESVLAAEVSEPMTRAARLGLLRSAGRAAGDLVLEHLRSGDPRRLALALGAARELEDRTLSRRLAAEIAGRSSDEQILLIQLLAERGDRAALPELLARAQVGEPAVRVAAVQALGRLGDPTALSVLLELAEAQPEPVAEAARAALSGFPEGAADETVIALLHDVRAPMRRLAIGLVGQRRLTSALPQLLRTAEDPDPAVRTASLKALAELAGPAEVPALIALLGRSAERAAVEGALLAACTGVSPGAGSGIVIRKAVYEGVSGGGQADVTSAVARQVADGQGEVRAVNADFGDPAPGLVKQLRVDYEVDGRAGSLVVPEGARGRIARLAMSGSTVDELCRALPGAATEPRLALLRVLRASRDPRALAAVREALRDPDEALRSGAGRVLCDWPDAAALPDLEQLARGAADAKVKILALRGLIRLVPESGQNVEQQVSALAAALELATRPDERMLVVSALGGLRSVSALAWLESLQGEPELAQSASVAATALAALLPAEARAWRPLSNGRDLEGWKQQGKGEFRVEDGCLVGTQTDGQGGDLFTTNTWRNLEIRFAYKMKWPGNSGLWFRDQYQFDILQYANPVAFSGTLYCPSKMFLFRNTDAAREQRDGWNQARILAYGDHLAMWLNGHLIGRCRDTSQRSGRVGIQVHGGEDCRGMEIRVKDLEIRPLGAAD
jgi:HEAT repeat protein